MHKPTLHAIPALLFLLLGSRSPLRAGEAVNSAKPGEVALEKQLYDAQRQLRDAARQLAQLHRQDAELNRLDVVKIQRIAEHAARDARNQVRIVKKIAPRARLGFGVTDSEDGKGALINAVVPGAPAAEAGLNVGDIITGINGSPLAGKDDDDDGPAERLADLGRDFKADALVTVDYLRDGAAHTATVKPRLLAGGGEKRRIIIRNGDGDEDETEFEMPEMPDMPDMPEMPEMHRMKHLPQHGFMMLRGRMDGLELINLTGDLGDYFGAHEGLLVLRVDPKGDLGLKAGDVILKVDGKAAAGPHDVMHALHHGKAGENVQLEIQRHQQRQSLSVKRPARAKERDEDFDFDFDAPEPPETPDTPDAPLPPRAPKAPRPPATPPN